MSAHIGEHTAVKCMSAQHEYPLSKYLLVSSVPHASGFGLLQTQRQFSRRLHKSLAHEHQLASERY